MRPREQSAVTALIMPTRKIFLQMLVTRAVVPMGTFSRERTLPLMTAKRTQLSAATAAKRRENNVTMEILSPLIVVLLPAKRLPAVMASYNRRMEEV